MRNYILESRKLSIMSKILMVMAWIVAAQLVDNEVILPSISSTLSSIGKIIIQPDFFHTVGQTLTRTLIGFTIALLAAMVTGILSSVSKIIYNLMAPILSFLNSIPTIAIIVLALIWLNNQHVPMFVGFIMVFPILYDAILNSIIGIDQNIIEMARLYKIGRLNILKNIYIPSIFYSLSSIFHSVISINLKMVIAGEVLAQPNYAIGSNLQLQRMYLNTSGVFAWIVITLLISSVFGYIAKGITYSLEIKRWK